MNDSVGRSLGIPEDCENLELDTSIAEWLGQHSRLAYQGFTGISKALAEVGYDRVLFFRSGGANAYLAGGKTPSGSRVWVLAFRGTESDYNDILVDITFFKRTADYKKEYRCHGGFLTSLQSFWGSWGVPDALEDESIDTALFGPRGISESLRNEVRDNDLLFITGHSLGGALASLAAYYIDRDLGLQVRGLYTYGSPRVFDRDMSTGVKDDKSFPIFRFVNSADIVPRVPPAVVGFRHCGNKCYLTRNGEIREHASISEILWDVGWLRLVYFGLVAVIASGVVYGMGKLVPQGSSLAWLVSGWSASLIGIVIAVLSLAWFSKSIPHLPKSICKLIGMREFTDHSIDGYFQKISGNKA